MRMIDIEVRKANIGEIVFFSSGLSVSKIEILSIDDKKTTCKNVKTGFVFKLDSDNIVKAQRELSKEYVEVRTKELKNLLEDAENNLKDGLKSGVYCHPSDADGITYLSGEAYTRMTGYIGQLQNELNYLLK